MAKKSKPLVANDIILEGIKQCSKRIGRKITYLDLARKLDINASSMWFPIHGQRAWGVERWLLTLHALGCLSFQDDQLIISLSKAEKIGDNFTNVIPL